MPSFKRGRCTRRLGDHSPYGFSEVDMSDVLDTIDAWVNRIDRRGKANVERTDLPWQAMQVMLSESVYGARVHRPCDRPTLASLLRCVFQAGNYESSAALARDAETGKPVWFLCIRMHPKVLL